jgi:FkbM family methyltransferase
VFEPVFRPLVDPGPDDRGCWDSAHVEYDLPDFDPSDVFIDIGCNVGGASHSAWGHGSRSIWAYEACPGNYAIGKQNLDRMPGARLFHLAVVGAGRPKTLGFPAGNDSFFLPDHKLVPVNTTTLDEILAAIGKPVRFLKIDCEGSEWEILYTCTMLDQIQEIKGEFHEPCLNWYALKQDPKLPTYDRHTLAAFLNGWGFHTTFDEPSDLPNGPHGTAILSGLFHAWR